MNFRTTIILAIVAGVLVILFLIAEPKKGDIAGRQVYLINESELANVSEIAIKKGDSEIICEKRQERGKFLWYLKKPIQAKAAEFVISEILSSVKWAQIQNMVKGSEVRALSDYGLDNPHLTATIKTPAKNFVLKFGKESEIFKGNIFLQLEGAQTIYAVAKSVLEAFNKDARDIREKQILQYESSDIVRVKLYQKFQKGTAPYYEEAEFVRAGEEGETWKVEKPSDLKVDIGQVNRLVLDVKGLEIKDFLLQGDTPLADFGLEMPETRIELYQKDNTKLEFHFGKRMPADQDKIYARDPTSQEKEILVLDYEKFSALPITIDSLKTMSIFDFSIEEIKGVTLVTETEEIELEKIEEEKDGTKTSKWVLRKPQVTIKEQYIEPFINNLLWGRIKEFLEKEPVDYATYGLDNPKCTLTFALKSDSTTLTKRYLFSTFSDEGDGYMKKDWDKQVYSVDKDFYHLLKQGTFNLLDNVMLNIDKENAISITCEYTYKTHSGQEVNDKYSCKYDNTEKKWSSIEPAYKEINENKMNELADKLLRIETKMILSRDAKDIPKFGLNQPHIKVTIKYKGDSGELEKTLLIATPTKTHNYAKLADSEIIFKLAPEVADAIMKSPYRD